MLILGRKVGESVMIGNNIKVTVCQGEGTNIRLGFEAPKEIEIHRQEVFDRIHGEKVDLAESDNKN
ncbi:MAG TPA: carbon storage regulator CsrA [Waddliaceae bacterium]